MSLHISERDRSIVKAIREFFEKKDTPQREKLQPVRLSDPESKAGLIKVMDKVGAKSLLQAYSIFAKK